MKNKSIILAVLMALLLVFSSGCSLLLDAEAGEDISSESDSLLGAMPRHVQESFADYESNNWEGKSDKTKGTHDNSKFKNRDGDLPEKDSDGNEIEYREHDVNNKREGHGRDAERFVSGSDGSVYFTDDHYNTFIQLK